MPTLTLTDEQADIVVEALKDWRGFLLKDWSKVFTSKNVYPPHRDGICERIDADIMKVFNVRTLVEYAIKVQKGIKTREEVAAEHGFDIEIIDAENARDKERLLITEEEAKRRTAIAKMVLAEVEAAEAFRKCAGVNPDGVISSSMHPAAEIQAYLELHAKDAAEDHQRVQIDFDVNGSGEKITCFAEGAFAEAFADAISRQKGLDPRSATHRAGRNAILVRRYRAKKQNEKDRDPVASF